MAVMCTLSEEWRLIPGIANDMLKMHPANPAILVSLD